MKRSNPEDPHRKEPARRAGKSSACEIIIVDDHPVFREGLSEVMNGENDLRVGAQADRSVPALELIRQTHFDLAIADVALEGGPNGIQLTKVIKAESPNLPDRVGRTTYFLAPPG